MVRQWQELLHEKNYSESYSEALPDFIKMAEAYGCKGIMAEKPEDLNLPNAVISRLVKEAVCLSYYSKNSGQKMRIDLK